MPHWPEYEHGGQSWVVECFPKLLGLFPGITQENLAAIHELGVSRKDFESAWGMVQRLCGIRPAILPPDVDASRLDAMSTEQVAKIYNVTTDEVEMTVGFLRAAWDQIIGNANMPHAEKPMPVAKPERKESASQKLEFTLEQLQLLELGTFSTSIFDYHDAMQDRYVELEWFTDRIREVRKVFEEPMAKALARMALLNELQVRRIGDKLLSTRTEDKEFVRLQNIKADMEVAYQNQWKQVEEICPAAMASQTRKFAIATLSDIIKAYQQYKADPNNRARDGVFTDDELQILFRSSMQVPDVPYRFGWVTAVNHAKLGICDPKWKRRLSLQQCKLLDSSFAYAAKKMIELQNMPQPDLESTGADGEYPPLHLESDGEITEPTTIEDPQPTNPNPSNEQPDQAQETPAALPVNN